MDKPALRVLMFGWEFPPHISGGLGTACFGITAGLIDASVDVLFVVPRLYGDEDAARFHFVNASDIPIPGIAADETVTIETLRRLTYIQIDSAIFPYSTPEEYARLLDSGEIKDSFNIHKSRQTPGSGYAFTGKYGPDLMQEVSRYALVAARIAATNQFDVIHAHDWLTYPAGIMARETSGKPLVIHVHATEFDRAGDNINQSVYDVERRGMHLADAIITVSGYTKQILIDRYGVPSDKITVVHNGAPRQHTKSEPRHPDGFRPEKLVTFLGRVTFQKGPEYFIEAAKKVLLRFPETHFVMAGSGDMLRRMIKRVAELRMSSRFHFTGFLHGEETNRLFAMSDVYVMPSVSEPFGISALEAIRSGVPVIVSKQAGVGEALTNVIKVDFWDVDALAASICELIKYESLSKTFVKESMKEIETMTWDNAALKIKNVYQGLIK